ncbi:MAG: hypothetical protein DI537_32920 [Stutzerimonas stutzeri]|nr:MAG: hypothetical protein DI537_32920 [Stutzerimonas stutzeri]
MNAHTNITDAAALTGLRSEAEILAILRAHIGIEDGAVVGLEAAARALVSEQPPHVLILAEIAAERQRQIDVEGWSEAHDDQYAHPELVAAGLSYLDPRYQTRKRPPHGWPWDRKWWKPKGYRRNFIRGMALLVANIEQRKRIRARAG